ncbi:MAG: hypothetical protein CM1200mP28_13230 [Deltaproteobacteria bacterium]|nr:MAG: hypothetical protein CM1200mP28_13230 [Deltaproteobacteria bacterium]
MSAAGVHLPVIYRTCFFVGICNGRFGGPYRQKTRLYAYTNTKIFPVRTVKFQFYNHWPERETLAIRAIQQFFFEALRKRFLSQYQGKPFDFPHFRSLISSIRIPIFPIPSRELAVAKRAIPGNFFITINLCRYLGFKTS